MLLGWRVALMGLLLTGAAAGEAMRGFGSSMMHETDSTILERLQARTRSAMCGPSTQPRVCAALPTKSSARAQALYAEKLRPLEKKSRYHEMGEPALSDAWFDAKPMVLLLGQYSVGKTSFINYLLGRGFPGQRIGPEMTTDRFVAVMYGDAEKTTPGNALTSQPDTPYHTLKKFGTQFLNRLEAAALPAPILKRVVLVDSPGVLAGEKQRSRGYDFNAAIQWFVQHADRVLLLFDAYKLDPSDEFKAVVQLLQPYMKKVHVVLNKADSIAPQDLMRVYGALMWMLGGVVTSAEVPRVYIGSFWDAPWEYTGMVDLMEAEEGDLIEDLATLPQNNVMNKINEIARRARLVQTHTYLLAHLRARVMNQWIGRAKVQQQLCTEEGLRACFEQVRREHDLSAGDFPNAAAMAEVLRSYDFAEFYKPSAERSKKLRLLRELMEEDIPEMITRLHTVQKRQNARQAAREQFRPQRSVRPPPPESALRTGRGAEPASRSSLLRGAAGLLRPLRQMAPASPAGAPAGAPSGVSAHPDVRAPGAEATSHSAEPPPAAADAEATSLLAEAAEMSDESTEVARTSAARVAPTPAGEPPYTVDSEHAGPTVLNAEQSRPEPAWQPPAAAAQQGYLPPQQEPQQQQHAHGPAQAVPWAANAPAQPWAPSTSTYAAQGGATSPPPAAAPFPAAPSAGADDASRATDAGGGAPASSSRGFGSD